MSEGDKAAILAAGLAATALLAKGELSPAVVHDFARLMYLTGYEDGRHGHEFNPPPRASK